MYGHYDYSFVGNVLGTAKETSAPYGGFACEDPGFDRALPNSLYLTSEPAFFGDRPWPWVAPAGATKLHTLVLVHLDRLHASIQPDRDLLDGEALRPPLQDLAFPDGQPARGIRPGRASA